MSEANINFNTDSADIFKPFVHKLFCVQICNPVEQTNCLWMLLCLETKVTLLFYYLNESTRFIYRLYLKEGLFVKFWLLLLNKTQLKYRPERYILLMSVRSTMLVFLSSKTLARLYFSLFFLICFAESIISFFVGNLTLSWISIYCWYKVYVFCA